MTIMDLAMLSLPVTSGVIGFVKYRLDETNNFTFGFFVASLIGLTLYAQTGDSNLNWLKTGW
jgi:hypothetical protein